MSSITAI